MLKKYLLKKTSFSFEGKNAWEIVGNLEETIRALIKNLGSDYEIKEEVAIHKSAVIGSNVVIKAPAIIGENCFIGANSFLRNGVFLASNARIGISCEVKTSIILENSAIAHFNFIGDSIIGQGVNVEAGAIFCNHYNEREDKRVFVLFEGEKIFTGLTKFGALVGDDCKIGANAVLSAGTLLKPKSIVKRLELVEQLKIGN